MRTTASINREKAHYFCDERRPNLEAQWDNPEGKASPECNRRQPAPLLRPKRTSRSCYPGGLTSGKPELLAQSAQLE